MQDYHHNHSKNLIIGFMISVEVEIGFNDGYSLEGKFTFLKSGVDAIPGCNCSSLNAETFGQIRAFGRAGKESTALCPD